jgi:succinoglycan biosynthesis transport protein ExoP
VEGEEKAKTKLFAATYTDNDPIKTKKVLEAMQRVYQDYNREEQRLRLAKGLEFIDKELPKVGESVIQAETALKQFRTNHKLIEPEVQAKDLTDAVNNIEQERRTNQSQYQEYQARYNALQQQVANSPQNALVSSRLSQSTRYQGLLNEIQKTELALAKERMRFTDENPVIQKLLFQRQEQLTLLQQEGQRSVGGNSAQLNGTGERLLTEGQLGQTDLTLVGQLLEVQKNIIGLRAREETLAQKEQQLRAELERFPGLLAEYNRLQPDRKTQARYARSARESTAGIELRNCQGRI